MKKLIVLAALTLVIFSQRAVGQESEYLSVQYSVGIGIGDMGDFISKPSFRGVLLEYRRSINSNLSVGIDFGWNVFYEKKDYDTYTVGTETLSGIQYRYQNELPMLAALDYNFSGEENPFKPYAGLGIGTIYTERATDMGLWRLEQNPWQFLVRPEVGFLYELSYSVSAKVAAKYYYGFAAGDLDEAQGYVSINVGLAFQL